MTRREEKGRQPEERERLARIPRTPFPAGGAGSFTSLLQTPDPPSEKISGN
jgi:hypothetical protein